MSDLLIPTAPALVLLAFFFGTIRLLDKAANWAGMSCREVDALIDHFHRKFPHHKRVRPGYPQPLLEEHYQKRKKDLYSSKMAWGFLGLNILVGGLSYWGLSDKWQVLLGVLLTSLVFEWLALLIVTQMRRESYMEDMRLCHDFHTAEVRVVGKRVRLATLASMDDKAGALMLFAFRVDEIEYTLNIWVTSMALDHFPWFLDDTGGEQAVFLVKLPDDRQPTIGACYQVIGVREPLHPNTSEVMSLLDSGACAPFEECPHLLHSHGTGMSIGQV